METWKCENCGYQYEGEFLEVCPSCEKSCGFVDATNYVPESFNAKGELDMANATIYCDPFCPSCADLAEFLKEKSVSFEFININENKNAAHDAVSISGQDKLPVVVVGKEVFTPPIDKEKLMAILEK